MIRRFVIAIMTVCALGCGDDMEWNNAITAAGRVKNPKPKTMALTFSAGLVTARPENALAADECTECENLVMDHDGRWRTRPGLTELLALTTPARIDDVKDIDIGLFQHTVIISESEVIRWNGSAFSTLGTCGGRPAKLVPFGRYMIAVGAGQNLPRYWDGTDFGLLYDDGVGELARSYWYNNRGGVKVDPIVFNPVALGGSTTRVAVGFYDDGDGGFIDASYLLPAGRIYLTLAREGDGYAAADGQLTLRIRQQSDDAIVYEKAIMYAGGLPQVTGGGSDDTDYIEYDVALTEDDLQGSFTGISPGPVTYYLSLEYSGGDASNHVWVAAANNTGDGKYYSGSWSTLNRSPYFAIRNTCPPCLNNAVVHNGRLWGHSTQVNYHPNYLWYSAAGDPFDWSTENGGGYIDMGRPIGGVVSYYDELWIFGTQTAPFLHRLTGTDPAAWAKTDTMQPVSAHFSAITQSADDVYFLSPQGVGSLKTIQEFGDVRVLTQTDAIRDKIEANWGELYERPWFSTAAFMGFDPEFGAVLLKLDDDTDTEIYVLHPKFVNVRLFGRQGYRSAPISRWTLRLPQIDDEDQAVTCFSTGRNGTYIATDQGVVYYLDRAVMEDDETGALEYSLVSGSMSTRLDEWAAWRMVYDMRSADADGSADLTVYVNGGAAATVDETRTVGDWDRFPVNFNFREIKAGYEDIAPADAAMSFGPIIVEYKNVGNL